MTYTAKIKQLENTAMTIDMDEHPTLNDHQRHSALCAEIRELRAELEALPPEERATAEWRPNKRKKSITLWEIAEESMCGTFALEEFALACAKLDEEIKERIRLGLRTDRRWIFVMLAVRIDWARFELRRAAS